MDENTFVSETRELVATVTINVLEGYNAGFTQSWDTDPNAFGEFTVYGFDTTDLVSATLVFSDGGASGEAVTVGNVYAGSGEQSCSEGGGACDDVVAGDVNLDGSVDVLDIVQAVAYILAADPDHFTQDCQFEAGDFNADGSIDVLDIVQIVQVILAGRYSDATEAKMNITEDGLSMSADGHIGGIQMTLSHDNDFSIELTDNAYIAEYRTHGNSTILIVINPEDELIFTSTGDYTIEKVLVTNSSEYIDVINATNLEFSLGNAYPNPFNPTTTIELNLAEASYASVKVFNLKGEVVGVLMDGMVDANTYTMTWNAGHLSSGVYMIRAEANGQIATQKVMLIK